MAGCTGAGAGHESGIILRLTPRRPEVVCNRLAAVLWVAAALVTWTPASTEAQRFRFTRLGLEHGLSQASVYSVAQDPEGFLWVGTQNGLNRYDGRAFRFRWETRGQPSPVSFGFTRALFVDENGRLWVGVDSHGVYVFERSREEFVPVPLRSGEAPGRAPEFVWDFAMFEGRVVVATSEGLMEADVGGGELALRRREIGEQRPRCGTAARAVWAESPTQLWIGTSDGCLLTLTSEEGQELDLLAELDGAIVDIGSATRGRVWVSSEARGALLFDRAGEMLGTRVAPGPVDEASSVLTSDAGDTWIATPHGLGWIPVEGREVLWFSMGSEENGDLPHEYVLALFEDRQGVVWVGTWSGLARVSPFRHGIGFIPTPSTPGTPTAAGVIAIQNIDSDRVRLGLIGGGLKEVSLDGSTTRDVEHPDMADVYSLATSPTGDLWVATNGSGVHRRSARGWRAYREGAQGRGGAHGDLVTAVTVDGTGTVWAGTIYNGLGVYDPEADRFMRFTPPESTFLARYIWPIVEGADGALWLGANGPDGGVHRLSADRTELSTYRTASSSRPNAGRILTLHVSGDTLVWFGTQGGGMGRLEPSTGQIRSYTTGDGLPHDNVPCILEDDAGKLWVSTNEGLARFDPKTERFWVFRERSGIQGNRFFANSCLRRPDGRLLFGGPNGVSVIDPSRIAPRDDPPPVALTAFTVRGRERPDLNHVTAQRGVELAPDENFFTIEFAALDFTDASLNAYRYRLEDLDPDWIEGAGGNTASYTSVPPDDYVFRVQARNSEGVWNRVGLTIPIVVHPPYYATWWFRLLMAALVGLAVWAAHRARQQQLARVRAMRLRITGDLHDDIGANLSAIALKSELLQKPQIPDGKRQSSLSDIERLARETTQKVREMIWVVKEEHDTVVGLVDHMRDAAAALLGGVIEYRFVVDDDLPEQPIFMELRQDVYLIFKEMLQNVLKHSGATDVIIEVTFDRAHLAVAVIDDGVGFVEAEEMHGHGLGLMRQRAAKHGALLELETSPGLGTRLSLAVEVR